MFSIRLCLPEKKTPAWSRSVKPSTSSLHAAQYLAHGWWKNMIIEMQQEHLCGGPAPFQQQHRARIHLAIGSASHKWRTWVTKKPLDLPPFLSFEGQVFADSTLPSWKPRLQRAVPERWKKHTHPPCADLPCLPSRSQCACQAKDAQWI